VYCELALLRRRGRRDDLCAHQLAELHGRDADAACGAQHQQRFAGAQIGARVSAHRVR
jgi:hypothetical protein